MIDKSTENKYNCNTNYGGAIMKNRYRYYNANPFGKIVDDCWLRSICTGEGRPYQEVGIEMSTMAIKEGYVPGDAKFIDKYLKQHGWVKQKQPIKSNGKKYTIKEFLDISELKCHCIVNAGNCHLTYFDDGYVYDIFDCTDRIMNSFYVPEDELENINKMWNKLKK